MSGVEKILQKIEAETDESCESVIAQAQERVNRILLNAQAEGDNIKAGKVQKAREKHDSALKVAHSTAEREQRMALLSAKTVIVQEVIDAAVAKLRQLPEPEYFDLIIKLVKTMAKPGQGTLRFSQSDLARLPKGYAEAINASLKDDEKSLVISTNPVRIDGGFVIEYDAIDQNCSFASLIESDLDQIKDELNEVLFAGAAA